MSMCTSTPAAGKSSGPTVDDGRGRAARYLPIGVLDSRLAIGQPSPVQDPHPSYLKVRWEHDNQDDPFSLYYELDTSRMTLRVVEVFDDGRVQRSDKIDPDAPTSLSWEPIPPLNEINEQPVFTARVITAEEFESVWRRGVASA
jgi:hypothetical protein